MPIINPRSANLATFKLTNSNVGNRNFPLRPLEPLLLEQDDVAVREVADEQSQQLQQCKKKKKKGCYFILISLGVWKKVSSYVYVGRFVHCIWTTVTILKAAGSALGQDSDKVFGLGANSSIHRKRMQTQEETAKAL